jgi:hypothetical protein
VSSDRRTKSLRSSSSADVLLPSTFDAVTARDSYIGTPTCAVDSWRWLRCVLRGGLACVGIFIASPAAAQESPYIVTYDHYLEEPGSLDIEWFSMLGTQRNGNDFHAFWVEFEYGVKGWWTTELYFDGQTTFNDSTLFTGFRWENRFRLLAREHPVNPVVYVEYEQVTEADKILKEIEGHDVESDLAPPNAILSSTLDHELEFKVLLSGTWKSWNVAVNPLATKNLSPDEPVEFGYALGASRPLGLRASPTACNLCLENFAAGVELYGGLGDTKRFGFADTSRSPSAAPRPHSDGGRNSRRRGLSHRGPRKSPRRATQ